MIIVVDCLQVEDPAVSAVATPLLGASCVLLRVEKPKLIKTFVRRSLDEKDRVPKEGPNRLSNAWDRNLWILEPGLLTSVF